MSQAIIDGSFETRSMEKTLLFTFLARQASPEKMIKWYKVNINAKTNITGRILMDASHFSVSISMSTTKQF